MAGLVLSPALRVQARPPANTPLLQGTIGDMLEDVNTGIAWVLARCVAYGGDPERVYVVGQSCGAQLGTLALLTQVRTWACACSCSGGVFRGCK